MSKKIIAFALAAVFAVSMAGPARADTISDLQAQIQSLLAQITQLQQQLNAAQGGTTTTTGLCISAGLKMGMKSDAVKTLQEGLKQDPAVYPEGLTTGYFGPLTKAAVIRFQEKYATEVLSPWGLTKGTGYVGQTTAAKFNALYCTPVAPTTTTTVAPEETTTTTTVAPTEGYFTYKVLATPPNNTSVYKGDSGKAVFGFSLKAQNSPMTVERVKFNFNKRPWLYFSNLYLYQGDTLLKQVEANSSAFEEVTAGSSYNLYITGLNVAIDKDVTKEFTLKVDMPSAISGTATSMTIQMAANAVRGLDAAGLNEYAPSSAKSRTIQIASATTGALEGSINSSTPAEGTAIVSTTDTTTDVPLLVFDLKAKNRDVTVNTIQVDISGTASNGLATVIPAVKLYDGNTLLDSETGTSTVTFGGTTALGLDITKDATKTLTVKVDVAKLATGYTVAGDHVAATVDTSNVTAEDSLYNTVSDLTGTATGHDIYFYNVAPTFTYVSKEVSVTGTDSQTHPQDTGNVSITFSVKANNGAIYIPTPSTLSTGIEETLTGTSSAVAAIGQITFTATPTADGVATATIDGTSVGYSYSTTTSDTAETVANGLAAAINANSTIYAEVHAATTSDDDGIINLTAATAGYAGNSITYSATTTASTGITASPTTATAMTGGLNTQSTSTTWSCESPADDTTASGYWYIPSGSTANCTFKDVVTNTSATAGWFKDTISSISWNTSNSLTNKIDQDWGLTNLNSGDFYLGI